MSFANIDYASGLPVLVKQPGESRVYRMDFSNLLEGTYIDSITSIVQANQGDVGGSSNLTIANQAISGDGVEFRLSGGTADERYKLTVTIVDSAGNTLEADGMLYVKET